jgi:hypothetical protein
MKSRAAVSRLHKLISHDVGKMTWKPLLSALCKALTRPFARRSEKLRYKKSAAEFMAAFGDYFTETPNDKPLPPLPAEPLVSCGQAHQDIKSRAYQVGDSDFFEVVEASGEALAESLAA